MFIWHYFEQIVKYLVIILNASFSQHCVPLEWHGTWVVNIFKVRERSTLDNYRSTSLTCTYCKVMQHVLATYLYKFFEAINDVLEISMGFVKIVQSYTAK